MTNPELVQALNQLDFQAYGPKDSEGKATRASLSIANDKGGRNFLTRVATEINPETGEADGYRWCIGKKMNPIA